MLLHLITLWFLYFPTEINAERSIPVYDFEAFEPILHRQSDTLYVVNFWATWCKPCVKELGAFDALERRFPGEKIKVILVSLDFEENIEKQVKPFLARKNIQSEVVVLDDPNSTAWIEKVDPSWSGTIPATVIYSKKGRNFYEKEFVGEEIYTLVKTHLTKLK